MAQLALELVYSLVIEVLCYGTGYFVLNALGLHKFERYDYVVGMVGFLFWFMVGLLAWHFFSV